MRRQNPVRSSGKTLNCFTYLHKRDGRPQLLLREAYRSARSSWLCQLTASSLPREACDGPLLLGQQAPASAASPPCVRNYSLSSDKVSVCVRGLRNAALSCGAVSMDGRGLNQTRWCPVRCDLIAPTAGSKCRTPHLCAVHSRCLILAPHKVIKRGPVQGIAVQPVPAPAAAVQLGASGQPARFLTCNICWPRRPQDAERQPCRAAALWQQRSGAPPPCCISSPATPLSDIQVLVKSSAACLTPLHAVLFLPAIGAMDGL